MYLSSVGELQAAGIALDAVTRGYENGISGNAGFCRWDIKPINEACSRRSRYLKQFEVKMVAEVGKERAIVYENGPHVTTPEWMFLPIHKGGTFGKFSTSIGLRVYDFLAGVKKRERRKMLSPEETIEKEPLD